MKKLLLILTIIPIFSYATIYQKTNADGSVSFSDQHQHGSTKVDISDQKSGRVTISSDEKKSPLQDLRKQFLGEGDQTNNNRQDDTHTQYKRVVISNPSHEQSFWNQSTIGVMVHVDPALGEGHKIQLFVDGGRFQSPRASKKFRLNNLPRGEHSVKAAIVDENGNMIKESASVTFFVHRTTVKETKLSKRSFGNL